MNPFHINGMAKMKRKGDLPQKVCEACAKPFAWRRKWKANWEAVKYCSDRCRNARVSTKSAQA